MSENPGSRPIALGAHPALPALLRALPALQVPVLPPDYARIEQVFPPNQRLPWSEARDLLADLLAKDPEQHQRVAEAFQRFIPPPSAEVDRHLPTADGKPAENARGIVKGQPWTQPAELPDAIESPAPPHSWIHPVTGLLLLLLLVSTGFWLYGSPEAIEPGTPREETDPSGAKRTQPGQLPSDPLSRFHAWVPVVQTGPEPGGDPLWPPALLFVGGILGVVWLWYRWSELKREPFRGLPRQRLQPGGQPVPAWRPEQWQLPRILDPAQRRDIVWGVQRFTSEQTTRRLDSEATVAASARAGIPRLCFEPARREREVWLWQDTRLRSREAAALADELENLLTRAGLPLRRAGFSAIPDPIWFDGRTPISAFDLGAAAREALVVIVSDGQTLREALHGGHADPGVGGWARRLLRELQSWPRVCRVDLDGDAGPDPLGLQRVPPDELPAWLAERPGDGTRTPDRGAGTVTQTQARLWAAACALPDLPITERQAGALYDRLGLPPAWRLPPPPLARKGAGQLHFSATDRRRLLGHLAERLWQTRGHEGASGPPGPVERLLDAALQFWKLELRKLDAAGPSTQRPSNRKPWEDSRGQHQTRITALLLDLWDADDRVRAEAIADLYALYRLYAAGPAGQPRSETGALRRLVRRRLGELSAQGVGARQPDTIRLPWRWDRLGERPGDNPGTARARLEQMGFAGAEPDSRRRPSLPGTLGLGAGLGMAAVGLVLLIQGLVQLPPPTVTQKVHGEKLEASLAERFARTARVERQQRRLRAIAPKLLLERTLPPNRSATVHWCWSGVPTPVDPADPCARLGADQYQPMVVNQLLTDADDDTVLLRAGSLAEPIRACAPAWPPLSVAVIEAPPWRYPAAQPATELTERALAARRLALRLLDSGAVDLAVVGPQGRAEAELLARRRADPDSQWLFFQPFDAEPPPIPPLGTEQARHQAFIAGDYEELARHLRDRIDGALDLHAESHRLPDAIARVHVLSGRPRLWGGPAIETLGLGAGATLELVQVCPGTFTMGATDLVRRQLPGIVAETLGRSPAELADDTPLDQGTLGSETRARLREALQSRLGASLGEEEWNAVTDLEDARKAFSNWLEYSDERPAHPVLMDGFRIARTETTEGQVRALRPDLLQDPSADDRQPAAGITWQEAKEVCGEAGAELPSEAQWEYAARGGSRTAWSWGDDARAAADHAWFSDNSGGRVQPVAAKRANPLGLRDMHGNLWEWSRDCYSQDIYPKHASRLVVDPLADSTGCRQRVLRGGSFGSEPRVLRSAHRNGLVPERRLVLIGFRCVRSGAPSVASSTP